MLFYQDELLGEVFEVESDVSDKGSITGLFVSYWEVETGEQLDEYLLKDDSNYYIVDPRDM